MKIFSKILLCSAVLVLLLAMILPSAKGTESNYEDEPNYVKAGEFYIADRDKTFHYELKLTGYVNKDRYPHTTTVYIYSDSPDITFDSMYKYLISSDLIDFPDFYMAGDKPIRK